MAMSGRLSLEEFGYSMPVDAPLYAKPPHYYRDAEGVTVSFETDAEAAASMIPEGLEVPSPAMAVAVVLHYPNSTLGSYHEAYIGIVVTNGDEVGLCIPHILVDNDQAMAAGREIWGYPKKLAKISLERHGQGMVGIVERPAGHRICEIVVQPQGPVEPQPLPPVYSLRVLPSPNPSGDDLPDRAQLVEVRVSQTIHVQWGGPASLDFGPISDVDRWSALPVKKLLNGTWVKYDLSLPLGKVIRDYTVAANRR